MTRKNRKAGASGQRQPAGNTLSAEDIIRCEHNEVQADLRRMLVTLAQDVLASADADYLLYQAANMTLYRLEEIHAELQVH